MCYIADGKSGACDRYANEGGDLIRIDPLTILQRYQDQEGKVVPFLERAEGWEGDIISHEDTFVTAIGGNCFSEFDF